MSDLILTISLVFSRIFGAKEYPRYMCSVNEPHPFATLKAGVKAQFLDPFISFSSSSLQILCTFIFILLHFIYLHIIQ